MASRTSPAVSSRAARASAALILAAGVLVGGGCERTPRREPSQRASAATPSGAPGAAPASRGGASAATGPAGPFVTFTDVARESGLAAQICHAGRKDPQDWLLETIGGGVIAFDCDGDGDMDALLVDGDRLDKRCEPVGEDGARTRLWRNDGGLRFTDVTDAAGIDVRGYGHGGAAADYDGDGAVDVAVAGYKFLRLLRNRGDGTFSDVTVAAGLPAESLDTSTSCAWGDLDGDGLADLFVTNYADQYAKAREIERDGRPPRSCLSRDMVVYCGPIGLPVGRNRVFFQRADHTFEERTATHLRSSEGSYSFQAVLSDFDDDGDLDVYVTNDGRPNFLYVNDGRGHLTDGAVECGASADESFQVQASMGVDVADYDRDGRLDLFVTNFSDDRNTLYRNASGRGGRLTFEDATSRTAISVRPQGRLCWGTKLVDFDNDTALDTFICCGHVYPEAEFLPAEKTTNLQRPLLLRGSGGPGFRFEDVTDQGGAPFAERRLWRGAAFADFDDDGDWDVLATALRDPPALLRNDGGDRNAWIRLDLRGKAPLTCAAGARVTVHLADGRTLIDELHLGSSYAGSNDPRVLIGVGAATVVPRVDVRWPDGTVQVVENLPVRRTHVVRQGGR